MKNKDILKKKIIYRSTHRGTKEMDLLLGSFVKKYINNLDATDLKDLDLLTQIDDETLHNFYSNNDFISMGTQSLNEATKKIYFLPNKLLVYG